MRSQRLLPALLLLFIGSGCAALIYEVVWFQLLELVIGSSAVSIGVLLGTFMGGMCLGSLLLPRLTGPDAHPLRLYAYLELGIGIIGLIVLFAMPVIGGAYTASSGSAIVGCLLAGFYLLRVHDVAFSTYVAVALNVTVAAIAFLIAKLSPVEGSA